MVSAKLLTAALAAALPASALPNFVKRENAASPQTITVTIPAQPTATGPAVYDWTKGGVKEFTIHQSCNATERVQLRQGLNEAITVATHARDHILRFGNSSDFYRKYFGKAPTGEPIGWLDKLINGDKNGLIFRCDDIDGNCKQDGWGGHWRGSNATSETVICPLSYATRKPLNAICGFGYTVAGGKLAWTFAGDLIHRAYHLPLIGQDTVSHYADSYDECLQLAKTKPEQAVRNTHSLQYFALDVYAYDIALPGVGCTGKPAAAAPAPAPAASSASGTGKAAPSPTKTAGTECHTHDNGDVHCS